uniref:Uncharacterized protein n=1 Tax=Anguilla anguilla TaxID=7936 RepID=A0A0E9WV87_ANGAN
MFYHTCSCYHGRDLSPHSFKGIHRVCMSVCVCVRVCTRACVCLKGPINSYYI